MIRKLSFVLSVVFVALMCAVAFAQGALPDVADPAASSSFVYRLYKAGHLVPAIVVGLFYGLTLLEKRVPWLRVGYRKVILSVTLAGLGELAERVADGTTPNTGMLLGTLGVAFTMWMKTQGAPAPAKPAESTPS